MDGEPFVDVAAERTILCGILQHGHEAYIDCEGLVTPSDYSDEFNQAIFCAIEKYYEGGGNGRIDMPTLIGHARKLGVDRLVAGEDGKRALRALFNENYRVELHSVRNEACKLVNLRVARDLDGILLQGRRDLRKLSGDEALAAVFEVIERPLFEFSSSLSGTSNDTKQIGLGVDDWLENIFENPRENLGIPSPFPKWNKLIGGGLRRRSINVIGARAKAGKSIFLDNTCLHIAGTLGIPILNLDTEMSDEEHWARLMAHLSGFKSDWIESGYVEEEDGSKRQFSNAEKDLLREKAAYLKGIPYYYRSVIDESFAEQTAAMRRWIIKEVGYNEDGSRKDCLIAYDYLQLTDPGEFAGNNFKEYQLLGFQMVALSRMAKRYDVPLLTMIQLNREGIDKRSVAVAAGSDRIIWKCSNFSILHAKEEEELAAGEGSRWLSNLISRHGKGGESRMDDISIIFDGATARMVEGKTRREIEASRPRVDKKGFEVDVDQGETFTLDDVPECPFEVSGGTPGRSPGGAGGKGKKKKG